MRDKLNYEERKKVDIIERRMKHLLKRIEENKNNEYRGSFDEAEISALLWLFSRAEMSFREEEDGS
jgi:hypothetical protein